MQSRTVKDRIGSLLNDTTTADVTFVVGEEQVQMPAHSVVMSTASDPFKAMFFGGFNRERVVYIPDASPDAFRELLRFIYTDEAVLTDDNLASVLSLADKYLVKELFDRCLQHVTAANVCRFLPMAELYAAFSEHCWSVALNNGDEVLNSEYFLDLPKELLVKLLASDDLQVDEKTVYNRAIDWARRRLENEGLECEPASIRAMLGDVFYLIRIPLFDAKDLADGPFASGIFNDKECFTLLVWFLARKGHLLFSSKARRGTDAVAEIARVADCEHEAQNFPLCSGCSATRAQKGGEHQHPTENNIALIGSAQSADARSARDGVMKRCIQSLLKKVVLHVKLCKTRQQTDCPVCKQAITLCCYHAKQCNLAECPVLFCSNIRQKLNEPERLLGLLREKCSTARPSCGHPGVHWICWDCYEPCCEIPECDCSLNVHNDHTKHDNSFNSSSVFCNQCGLPITSV
ncbi:BTB/POZ domain-containing protein 6 [Aphelenchoides avenae]|nr:BTB/POZ domain-containing protein 6 [Aphelenchus avenae]